MRGLQFLILSLALCLILPLAGCNTALNSGLNNGAQTNNSKSQQSSENTQVATANAAVTEARYKLHFLPVTGAPANHVSTLSKALQSQAIQNKVVMVSANQGERYRVKGFFSAFDDGNGTLVVYVWDILDANNQRKHRINGQQKINKSSSYAWNAVDASVITNIGKSSMQRLDAWVSKQR
jgi:hypothetical protein